METLDIDTDKGLKTLAYAIQPGNGFFVADGMDMIKKNCRALRIDLRRMNNVRYSLRRPLTVITVVLPDACAQFIVTPRYRASQLPEFIKQAPPQVKNCLELVRHPLSILGFQHPFILH